MILRRPRTGALIAVFALAGGIASADGGGVSVETGETLFSQGTSLALTLRHERSSQLYRGTHRVRNHGHLYEKQTDLILAASFGLSETLTLGLVAPWTGKEDRELKTSGFADADFFFKQRFWFDGGPGWEATAALVLGVQLPTGSTHEDAEPEMQPGSGSWDPFFGAAATYEWDRFEVRANALFQANTRGAHEFEHEDLATLGAGFTWRPWMEKYPGPEASVSLGLSWEHAFPATDHGRRVENSGGDTVFASLGASFAPRAGWRISLAAAAPVWQDLDGTQLSPDLRLSLTLSVLF